MVLPGLSGTVLRFCLLLVLALLTGCTPSHLYVSLSDGPIAYLQEKSTRYEDRNGESLQESYRATGIDGRITVTVHLIDGSEKGPG